MSAGGDNSLLYWKVGTDGAVLEPMRFDQRSGEVTAPGVSPDGKYVLYDQGKELRVLSLVDGRTEGMLQNPGGAMNFTTMAQFSPDGKMILTAAASEGRLQLWRATRESSARLRNTTIRARRLARAGYLLCFFPGRHFPGDRHERPASGCLAAAGQGR